MNVFRVQVDVFHNFEVYEIHWTYSWSKHDRADKNHILRSVDLALIIFKLNHDNIA